MVETKHRKLQFHSVKITWESSHVGAIQGNGLFSEESCSDNNNLEVRHGQLDMQVSDLMSVNFYGFNICLHCLKYSGPCLVNVSYLALMLVSGDGSGCICWVQLSRFHLKTARGFCLWNVVLIKNRTTDYVQKHNNWSSVCPSMSLCVSVFAFLYHFNSWTEFIHSRHRWDYPSCVDAQLSLEFYLKQYGSFMRAKTYGKAIFWKCSLFRLNFTNM
jgi:hypothetical protein